MQQLDIPWSLERNVPALSFLLGLILPKESQLWHPTPPFLTISHFRTDRLCLGSNNQQLYSTYPFQFPLARQKGFQSNI
jgi:hypothetical protein